MSIVAADLSDEILDELGELEQGANQSEVVLALSTGIATVFNGASGAQSWTPTIQIGGVNMGGTYTHRQGRYWVIGDLVIALCKVAIGGMSTSNESIRISGLPFTAGTQLAHWPTWMSQCSLISGDAHARMAASTALLYINDDQRDGITIWNFAGPHSFYAAVGVAYIAA